jgi:hypothetical protein
MVRVAPAVRVVVRAAGCAPDGAVFSLRFLGALMIHAPCAAGGIVARSALWAAWLSLARRPVAPPGAWLRSTAPAARAASAGHRRGVYACEAVCFKPSSDLRGDWP